MIVFLILWFLCGIYTLLQSIRINNDISMKLNDNFWITLLGVIIIIIVFPIEIHSLLTNSKE
jgi:tellurite resistance protein TehA-like permease